MYNKNKGPRGTDTENHVVKKGKKPIWEDDPDITGEHKIDIGLHRRSIENFFIQGPIPLADYVTALAACRT